LSKIFNLGRRTEVRDAFEDHHQSQGGEKQTHERKRLVEEKCGKNGLAEPQLQARTSIPDRGLRLLANLPPHHAFLPQTLMM
jgi:hypothetical protein